MDKDDLLELELVVVIAEKTQHWTCLPRVNIVTDWIAVDPNDLIRMIRWVKYTRRLTAAGRNDYNP
jgi:hypothetical protein